MSNQGRGTAKRKVKPVEPQAQSLLDFDLGEGESSDDSDFRIEDHPEESDDYSINSDDDGKKDDSKSESSDEQSGSDIESGYKNTTKMGGEISVADLLEKAKNQEFKFPDLANVLICAGCLGSRSDDFNEIVECDGCGVTVHEGCYGVSDVTSESSTVSSASTEPWFCEACKAGVTDPSCELCPNKDTIMGKQSVRKVGPGCTSMKRGSGQREGLLAEAHSEEVEQADPFYAHCRLHSDKTLVKKRKRNWLALQLRTENRRKYAQQKENRNPPWVPTQKMARMLYSSASAMRKFQRKAECMGIDIHALEFQDAQMAALRDVSRRWHVPPAFSVEFVGYYLERNTRVTSLRRSLERLTAENDKLLAGDDKLRSDYDEKLYDAIIVLCPKKTAPAILMNTPLLPPVMHRSTPKVTPQQLQKRSMSVPTAAALKMGVGFPLSDNPDARQGKVLSTQCSECDKTSDSEPEVLEKKVPRRSRIRYSKDGAIISEPVSPTPRPASPIHKNKPEKPHKPDKQKAIENLSPIKMTIKPFEFSSDGNEAETKPKKEKKRNSKKEHSSTSGGEGEGSSKKVHKRSFTSPILTNTPLMSITPIVADSPYDSHNEQSNESNVAVAKKDEFVQNLSFSSLLNDSKERDSKAIESSIENTLANLSSDIANYKANRKRRKEKHRNRYSPDLLRSPSKSHKHKRKKKNQDMENPEQPHPRITIKIKPLTKPDGSLDTQMFYVPTDSNDGPPPAVVKKISKQQSEPELEIVTSPTSMPVAETSDPLAITTPRSRESRVRKSSGVGGAAASGSAALSPLTQCDVCVQAGGAADLVRIKKITNKWIEGCFGF
ncbi:unnamed protein product [Leptidea sinapis]|uniref:PHD-type domain-containing protein n=1 Tax=Leptidea sinapis TaxID=189913 RepID=A0A5E4QVV4_9NEOP|nr:unnamed protein product [Leptidea sinapis]